jgi:putative flavoprotein involved in K+ transport
MELPRIAQTREILPELHDRFPVEGPAELNLDDANMISIIWATGYGFDFSLARLPAQTAMHIQSKHWIITASQGLYFFGMPWLHSAESGLVLGLEETQRILLLLSRVVRSSGTLNDFTALGPIEELRQSLPATASVR